jgi:predicted amidophosphoribosyltransferase
MEVQNSNGKIGGFTHKEMREIREKGRSRAETAMRKQREDESGPLCRVCRAPLSKFSNLCVACGTVQDETGSRQKQEVEHEG